jgi:copper(I)-binding protein
MRSQEQGARVKYRRDRRHVLGFAAASAAGLLMRPASACEFVTDTLRVTHPWARASAPGATSALLGMRIDEVIRADRLIEVSTPIATGAELAAAPGRPLDLEILPGSNLEFSETGIQLRLTGLKTALFTGRDYPLTIAFAHGGVVEARLIVDQALLPTFRFL